MVQFKNYPGINEKNEPIKLTIAAGPIIIENNKVLLDKHGDDGFWKFPGGRLMDNNSMQENAKREVKEELGLDVELLGDPFVLNFMREQDGVREYVILIHYLAKNLSKDIEPGRDIKEWQWHDVKNLPDDCAPNIEPVVNHFLDG